MIRATKVTFREREGGRNLNTFSFSNSNQSPDNQSGSSAIVANFVEMEAEIRSAEMTMFRKIFFDAKKAKNRGTAEEYC